VREQVAKPPIDEKGETMSEKGEKHTPGPWRIFGGMVDGYGITGSGETIIEQAAFNGLNNRANASLIAAEPDLLEAVKYWFDSKADPKKLAEMARTAIAKAEGRTV
jgi:hypothetical protein